MGRIASVRRRFSAGFRLAAASARTVWHEPQLIAVALTAVVGYAAAVWSLTVWLYDVHTFRQYIELNQLQLLIPAGLASFIPMYANAVIVATVVERARGNDPDLRTGLRAATRHLPALLLWAMVNAGIGALIRTVAEKIGMAGRLVGFAVGMTWHLATMFVVPVLLFEHRGATGTAKRSATLFRETWGENVSGVASLGLALLVVMVPSSLLAAVATAAVAGPSGMTTGLIAYMILFFAVASLLNGAFRGVLYRYAATGAVAEPFAAGDLQTAFRPKDGDDSGDGAEPAS